MHAAAICVPIDPGLPTDDREALLDDAGVRVLLLPASPTPVDHDSQAGRLSLRLELATGQVSNASGSCGPVVPARVDLSGALYLMYTSGSTGRPKAVVGTEQGTLNRIQWAELAHPWCGEEVVLRRTPLSFVDSVAEVWGTLLGGQR